MEAPEILLKDLETEIPGLEIGDALRRLSEKFAGKAVFSTSFSMEDQVIAHVIFSGDLPIELFTLDTGRLFPETYSTWERTLERFGKKITPFYPDALTLQHFVEEKGPNSFYDSVENRKLCCHLRKVEPLQRALKGKELWITGIRAEHSGQRSELASLEWDATNRIIKYHPLMRWTTDAVKEYIHKHEVPYNPLQEKGYISIGCAPCTRAVKPGEDFRSGRWWWENNQGGECGLHVHDNAIRTA